MLRNFAASLLVVLSWLASGCCCVDRVYRPSSCTDGWDLILGSCEGCGACGGDCVGRTPTQETRHRLTCASGCGEVYWGEWLSNPPDDCDPCDGCGNWVGARCCKPRWWERLRCGAPGFWGWRCGDDAGCGHGAGCSSCGSGEEPLWDGDGMMEGTEGELIQPSPARPQPNLPRDKTGPTEAQPKKSPPQPTPDTQARHTRVRSTQPKLLMPPTERTARPRPYREASSGSRARNGGNR